METITAKKAREIISKGAILVDIRSHEEYRREHIEGAYNIPSNDLSEKLPPEIAKAECIIFHCLSGGRTKNNESKLENCARNGQKVFIMEEGMNGWKSAGLETKIDKKQPLPIIRQVQIAAGSLVLIGVILSYAVNQWFFLLSGFVGCGLIFAGATGFCGMANMLEIMPWNKR